MTVNKEHGGGPAISRGTDPEKLDPFRSIAVMRD
jgi:hypothetical protein